MVTTQKTLFVVFRGVSSLLACLGFVVLFRVMCSGELSHPIRGMKEDMEVGRSLVRGVFLFYGGRGSATNE